MTLEKAPSGAPSFCADRKGNRGGGELLSRSGQAMVQIARVGVGTEVLPDGF